MPEIPSSLMQEWIQHPKDLQKALWTALCPLKTVPMFKAWRTIKIGSVEDLSRALAVNGFPICSTASDIMERMVPAPAETAIELVRITARELGFNNQTRRDAIYARAKEFGLDLVPAEVGPQLRLQYGKQPAREWLLIGMEPILTRDFFARIFGVGQNKHGKILFDSDGNPAAQYEPSSCWVFARRKQS